MKRIKNSVKALIISICVLVVAAATVVTVVLLNRHKEDNGGNPGQKYVLTAAQKDLVAAINAKNLAEFEASKKTFTVGDCPLFVDEYGVAVDANKITYVYDDYFTAEIDDAEEVFIFNPADETKTIRLSKYLKEAIPENSSFLANNIFTYNKEKGLVVRNFYTLNEEEFVDYMLIEINNESQNFVSVVYSITYEADYLEKKVYENDLVVSPLILTNENFIFIAEEHYENAETYYSYDICLKSNGSKIFSTGLVKNGVIGDILRSDDNRLGVVYGDNAYFASLDKSNKLRSYNFKQSSGASYEYYSTSAGYIIEKTQGEIKTYQFYSFANNSVSSLELPTSCDILSVEYVDYNYFYICAENNKQEKMAIYFDKNGKQVISYNVLNERTQIRYSNGRKIVTDEAIISTKTKVEAFVDYNIIEEGVLSSNITVFDYIVLNENVSTIMDIDGNKLFGGKEYEKIIQIDAKNFIAINSELNETYLLNAETEKETRVYLNTTCLDNLGYITINGEDCLVVKNQDNTYKIINTNQEKVMIDGVAVDNIETVQYNKVANLRILTFDLEGNERLVLNSGNFGIVTTGESFVAIEDNEQMANSYADAYTTASGTGWSASWSDGTSVTFTISKPYYATYISFKCYGTWVDGDNDCPYYKISITRSGSGAASNISFSASMTKEQGKGSVSNPSFTSSTLTTTITCTGLKTNTLDNAVDGFRSGTSPTVNTGRYYTTIYYYDQQSTSDYKDSLGSSGHSAGSRTKYINDTANPSAPSINQTILGGKYVGFYSTVGTGDSVSTNHSYKAYNSVVADGAQPNVTVDGAYFKNRYIYAEYRPIKYKIEIDYGVIPGTSTKMEQTNGSNGLHKPSSYDNSNYTNNVREMTYNSSTFPYQTGTDYIPTAWFFTFQKWVVSGAYRNNADYVPTSTSQSLKNFETTEDETCKITAVWQAVNISVSFTFMTSSYQGKLQADHDSTVDLRISSAPGLNGLNFSVGGANKLSSNSVQYKSSESMKFTYAETTKIKALDSASGLGVTNSTTYDNYLGAKTVNSKYLLYNKSGWIINESLNNAGVNYYTLSDSVTTIKTLLLKRSDISAGNTTIPDHSIEIIATYIPRNYYISLKTDPAADYIADGGGKIINGSVIKDNTSITSLDITNKPATYQFIAQKDVISDANIAAANTSNMFTRNYSFLDDIYLRVETTKVDNERAYLLSQVKLSNFGAYTNATQTSGVGATITFTRNHETQQWVITSDYGIAYNSALKRYNLTYNQVSGLDAGEYYNGIEIDNGKSDDYALYIKIHNLGVTICDGTLNNKDGEEGFVVEAIAISNRQAKDTIEIAASGENNGSGHVVDYAVMYSETTNRKVWINNNKISWDADFVVNSSYAFVAKSEYISVPGETVTDNIKKYDGKEILANYGNTNVIVIRPNQSFYYSSAHPYILSGGNGGTVTGENKPLNYALQSYLSQIVIDGNTYHFDLTRTISSGKYNNYVMKAGTGAGPSNLLTKITSISSQKFTINAFASAANNRDGDKGTFTILEGYQIPSSTGRMFEIYLAQCALTHEILYFIYSDHAYDESQTTVANRWKPASIKIFFKDFENELSINVPNSGSATGGYVEGNLETNGSNEFIYTNSTQYDTKTVVYEYMYTTAGTYGASASLGNGDSEKRDLATYRNSLVKFDSTGLRSAENKGTGAYDSYFGSAANSYLSDDRKFKINPNESMVFLFHPKDGYLINTITIKIGDKDSESKKLEMLFALNTAGVSAGNNMDISYPENISGSYMGAQSYGYNYTIKYFTADDVAEGQNTGVYVTNGFEHDWQATESTILNSVYILISGIADDISIDVTTTSYLEFDFVDKAENETSSGTFSGLVTQNKRGTDIREQKIDILNKLQILYKNGSEWVKVSATDADTTDDPEVIKYQNITGDFSVYRIIFFGKVNKFKNGVKFYLSGTEYSSYLTNMRSYGSTNTSTDAVHSKINTYITQNKADISGRRADGRSFYNNGAGYNYGAGATNVKSINNSNDALTYLYIADLRLLFNDLAPNATRASNIFSTTSYNEYINKFHLKFDVYNNLVDYNIGSYLYNSNIYNYYKENEESITTPTTVTPVNSSNTSSNLNISTINGNVKYINEVGAYQLDFVAPGKNGYTSVLKQDSWFNDVMLSSIQEQRTTLNLEANMAYHYNDPDGGLPEGHYYGYDSNISYNKYWQDYDSVDDMRLRDDTGDTHYGIYGYGINYEYINIPGYKLQYLELKTVDYGNLYIDIDAIYNNASWSKDKPYVVHLNKGTSASDFTDYFIAISIELINETNGKTGYRIRLYDVDSENNSYKYNNNYGDFNYGRSSIEIISNNIEVNFYLNAYSYTISYDVNKGNASPNNTDIKIIEGEKQLEGKTGADVATLSQTIYYDSMTVLDYQLYMPGYSFIGWGSNNYYVSQDGTEKARYDAPSNTWNSSVVWDTPYMSFAYKQGNNTPWLKIAVTDVPYDLYIKNNSLNGYFITDTGISGAIPIGDSGISGIGSDVEKIRYLTSVENYNFWYAYASKFVVPFTQEGSNTNIKLYGIWKANVYSLIFDTNDANIRGLESTEAEKTDEEYQKNLDEVRNGSTEAKLNIITSSVAGLTELTLSEYKTNYVQKSELYDDTFTDDGRGYNVLTTDANGVPTGKSAETYYCYVAFDSDLWYITQEDLSKPDTYFSYFESATAGGADASLNDQLLFSEKNSGNLLNLVIDRYGYTWLGWFKKKLDNTKSSSESNSKKTDAVFTSTYLNSNGSQSSLPKLNIALFKQFEDKCDFDITEVDEGAEEPAPASETPNQEVNKVKFVYAGEHKLYDDPRKYLNYVQKDKPTGGSIDTYICFYRYSRGTADERRITINLQSKEGNLTSKFQCSDDTLNKFDTTGDYQTRYLIENKESVVITEVIMTYFDTSVSYDCYSLDVNATRPSDEYFFKVVLNRSYSQILDVKTEGEDKIVSLKRNKCNFRYLKLYANWEVNKYTIKLDKQDNSSNQTLNNKESSTSADNNSIKIDGNLSAGSWYFDDENFAFELNNYNPDRIGYDFLGWSFYYYDINNEILEDEEADQNSFEVKLNKYYKEKSIINKPSVYLVSNETGVESTMYLNQTLLNAYDDYIEQSVAAVLPEAPEGEGGEVEDDEAEQNQEIMSAGLQKVDIIPLYSYDNMISTYANGNGYKFRDTYTSVSAGEKLYQEQYGDSEHDSSNSLTGNGHYIYLFAIWRAQTFVINTSLNVEKQQLDNLYDEDSRFAVAFYNAVKDQEEPTVPETPEAGATAEETPAEGEGEIDFKQKLNDVYADYVTFTGINSNNYKLVYNLKEDYVYDKIDTETGKPMDPATGTVTDNPVKKIQFTDIVATVYFTVTFDESLLDAYFNIPDSNGVNVKYYLKDLFAVSAGYYFLGWVTNVDGNKNSLSSGNYIVRNTLNTLFSNLDDHTDNVVLRPQGEETDEEAFERLETKIDDYYSRYVFGGQALTVEDHINENYEATIFNKSYYEKVYVTNYKHHFAENEQYVKNNYTKLQDVDKYNASTNFGYVKIDGEKHYIQIDDLLSSQDATGLTSTAKKLHFRYNGWKYYVYYLVEIDGNSEPVVLQNDYENLYFVDNNKTKYIVRFDSEGYAYALTQQYPDYNKRLVFDHTNGGYKDKYPDEKEPLAVNLKIAVFLEGHNKVQFDDDGTFKNMDSLTNLAQASSGNKYNMANLLSKDGKEAESKEMEFVPCQTRQFTVFAHWQNKTDLVMNVINSSNILPKEEEEEGAEGEETPEGGEEPEATPEEEEEGPGYDVSPSYNPGLAGYYEIYDNSEHDLFTSSEQNVSYSQSFINDGGEKKTVNELDEKVEYKFNYYDSLSLNILPYYNGRYLSTVKFTYYGTEENSSSGPNIITNTFRNMKYTLVFKFRWNDVRRIIQLASLTYTKSTAGNAEYFGSEANYQSLVLYKNYDEDDIRTNYYVLKDVGIKNDQFTEFSMFDSLSLLNDTGFVEVAPDGTEISEAERYYMMRIYEYFEYDEEANYDSKCKELGYILDDRTPQTGVSKYIIQDVNKVMMNFPNIKTSLDIECQFSVQTFGINFYNILDEEGNTITVQAGKSNVYDTNYENEEEFKQAYENNEFFKSHENASKSNLPTIPQDCSYVDELTASGTSIEYNVPYGYFIYGVYFKSAFSPHRPIDTGVEAEEDGLPNNIKFLEYERYGFDYIYSDGNYNIGTTSRLFKFSPVDEYDTDKHKYQCSPVLGSTSSFNEANGIRLDSLTFYMFGGWFESQVNKDSGRIEFVLYNQLSEATYINRHIDLYGYYYMVNTPTSITYYTWKEETQKYEAYASNKDQYALNANIENKPFNKQSDKLTKVEGFSSYTDSDKYAKIFTYQKYGVDATTFANDNYTEGDFNQNNPSDLAVLYKMLTTYWYYEDSYIVLKSKTTGKIVKYDEDNNRFTLNGNPIEVYTTDMVNFRTASGEILEPTKMYSENILKHKDDAGNFETLKKPVEGATLYYKYNGNYYPFKKLSSGSYRYSLDINGDNSVDYYFLKKGSSAGSSKFIYTTGGTPVDAGESLEVIYNYYVVYDRKYYQIQYGLNPLATASAASRQNVVNIPLGDEAGTIARCYFDYKSKRLYDMATDKEVRFLYEIYCAVNDNYAVNATYTTPKWGISGIKVKSLPSPNMTYWYNDEKYGLVGYIKLTDAIFEGMKKADSVFGEGEGEEPAPTPATNSNGSLGKLPDGTTLYGDGADAGGEGTEGEGEGEGGETPPVEDDGIDESIKNGILYKSFMNNIEVMYKDIWSEFLDDGTTENPNYDAKFKRELKFALGNYIGSYTKEQMLESFLIADEFHMNADNNAIEYITVNIPIKYSGEIPTKTEGVSRKVEISIIIKYKFDIISTNTLVEENIYAIPIYSPYLMSFDTNDPCYEAVGKELVIDVDKMDLWHFELTSKDTHVYNEENNDKLKLVILSEEEMIYLKSKMIDDIPTMLTIMFNNYQKHLDDKLPEGELWINPNVGEGRVFIENFEMVTNADNTQYKKWSIKANLNSLANGKYYAIAFYEKTVNSDLLGNSFKNYVVRTSDNFIRFNYSGVISLNTRLVTIEDIELPE